MKTKTKLKLENIVETKTKTKTKNKSKRKSHWLLNTDYRHITNAETSVVMTLDGSTVRSVSRQWRGGQWLRLVISVSLTLIVE